MLRTTFENRKDLVKAVSEYAKAEARYMGAPTFAYKVDCYTIAKDGSITSAFEMGGLGAFLDERGFIQSETETGIEENTLTFSIPLEGAEKKDILNFITILHSKQYLINKALGATAIAIDEELLAELETKELSEINMDKHTGFRIKDFCIEFDYPYPQADERFIPYMSMMSMAFSKARESTRVRANLIKPENEKYYMRSWLIRIGLGGKGGAETRKVLLKNLKGHSAFRTKEEMERARERYRQRKGV